MKVTQASRYAVAAVVYLAAQKSNDYVTSRDIARAQGLPELFLLKSLKPLVGAGILRSIKGPGGGYRLARRAGDISLLEVIEAVDGPLRGWVDCADRHVIGRLIDRLQQVCEQAASDARRRLAKVRIVELG